MRGKFFFFLLVVAVGAGVYYYSRSAHPHSITLTGIVTTDDVIASAQIQGRIDKLTVDVGYPVTKGQLLAEIEPGQWLADKNFYESSRQQSTAELAQAQADLENSRLSFERMKGLYDTKVESLQNFDVARTSFDSATAHVESIQRQIQAAAAQEAKAQVYLDYTRISSPFDGIVDTRDALQGEVVNPGQAIVTLINQDDLWVRADVEETYIDSIHLGDKMTVTLPSGAQREGTVFYRGVDADYATQRDVSRTKRDIKTFEIRLRCDNKDRALALGMTAYIELPIKTP